MKRRLIITAILLLAGGTLATGYWLAGTSDEPLEAPEEAQAYKPGVSRDAPPREDVSFPGEVDLLEDGISVEEEMLLSGEDARSPRWRRRMSVAEAWETLRPLAEEGDVDAAFRLATTLDRCRIRLAQNPEIERRRLERVPAERRERVVENLRQAREDCRDAVSGQLDTAIDWLTQAADFGHAQAQIMWPHRSRDYLDLSDESMAMWHRQRSGLYLAEARDSGHVVAMQMIARRDAGSDPVNSWAHTSLALRVLDERMRSSTSPRRRAGAVHWEVRLYSMLDSTAAGMSSAQIATAQQRADELYESCCRR